MRGTELGTPARPPLEAMTDWSRLGIDRARTPVPASLFRDLRAGFVEHAHSLPDRPALLIGKRSYSYAEADDTARRWAA